MTVHLDVDLERNRLIMRYTYSAVTIMNLGNITGSKVKHKQKSPHEDETYFYTKLSIDRAKEVRAMFGDNLTMTPECREWAHKEKVKRASLSNLSTSDDAELELVPTLLPEMYQLIDQGWAETLLGEMKPELKETGKPRPFQKADIAFAAKRQNSCNFNHQGLGKTIEVIGAIAESGALRGSNLVACPVVSKESVWAHEWASWVRDVPALVTPEGRANRQAVLAEAVRKHKAGEPFLLIVNPAMIKMKSEFKTCDYHTGDLCKVCEFPQVMGEKSSASISHKEARGHAFVRGKPAKTAIKRNCDFCDEVLVPEYPELYEVNWDFFVMDEIQKMGIYDMGSMTYKGLMKIPRQRSILMSGTPFAGKAINVYNILHLMDPKEFSNKMEFANEWLKVSRDSSPFTSRHALNIGELKSCHRHPALASDESNDCELCQEIRAPFWEMLASHVVRRTKAEYLSQLPPKIHIDIWVEMTPAQRKQYEAFAEEAEVTIDEYELGAVDVLAEYSRLKQFAGAVQEVEVIAEATIDHPMKYKLTPTYDSPKLPQIWEILENLGITKNEPVDGVHQQAVIFSESKEMVNMVARWLNEQGVPAETLTGDTPAKQRSTIVKQFQKGETFRVMVISTLAAGFSINLDRASTAIFLDETWNPDDQEQAEDRIHRGSRIHQVTVYFVRTTGTIQELIRKKVGNKSNVNEMLLAIRRRRTHSA